MKFDLRVHFSPEYIEKTAEDLVSQLPLMGDWDGCTRLDIATALGITVILLEKAMKLNASLKEYIAFIEQKTLLSDVQRLKYQISEKRVNPQILKLYFGIRHGVTDRRLDELFKPDRLLETVPTLNYSLRDDD